MQQYVYRRTENRCFTVGFFDPAGKWHPESDWTAKDSAAGRVHYLNGGNKAIMWELAYDRGYRAYTDKNYHNPYPRRSPSCKFWDDGYSAARENVPGNQPRRRLRQSAKWACRWPEAVTGAVVDLRLLVFWGTIIDDATEFFVVPVVSPSIAALRRGGSFFSLATGAQYPGPSARNRFFVFPGGVWYNYINTIRGGGRNELKIP